MTTKPLPLLVIGVLGLVGSSGPQHLSYLGPGSQPESARVRLEDGRETELRRSEPSVLGELRSVDEEEIVIDQPVAEEERERLRDMGLEAPDVLRFHVRRFSGPGLVVAPGSSRLGRD